MSIFRGSLILICFICFAPYAFAFTAVDRWFMEGYYNHHDEEAPTMVLPLTTSLYASVCLTGGCAPTFTRATAKTCRVNDGLGNEVIVEITSGEPCFTGAYRAGANDYRSTLISGVPINDSSLLGYAADTARTNKAQFGRDLTQVGTWAATNMNTAKDATGIDGVANSASTITATADNATILQTITLAAAGRSYSVWLKRKTGTGAVSITRDGVAYTVCTVTSSWSRCSIENTSVLNPQIGIKLATSGDAVYVDGNQDEDGAFITGTIFTPAAADVTRNADLLTYPIGVVSATAGTIVTRSTVLHSGSASANRQILDYATAANENMHYRATNSKLVIHDGANSKATTGTLDLNASNVLGTRYGASGLAVSINGTVETSATFGSITLDSVINIGSANNSLNQFTGAIKGVKIWNRELSTARFTAETTK